MSIAGVYLFFTLFCGVPAPEPIIDAAWIETTPEYDEMTDSNEACYLGTDIGLPGDTDDRFYDI